MRVRIVQDALAWRDGLKACGPHDFAHTWAFHDISRRRGEGDPELHIVLDDQGRTLAAWPLLRRSIAGDRHDLTSVYGHVGPLVADRALGREALTALVQGMTQRGAVSLFSRMHPVLDDRLPEDWRGEPIGNVVVIDAAADAVSTYRPGHRQEVARAQRLGVTVREASDPAAIALFHDVYTEAMSELGASDFYRFDQAYLAGLCEAEDFAVTLLFAEHEGRTVSASMFITTGDVMQYYLSGTRPAHRALAASKLLIAEAHRRAAQAGVRWLILGGGVGSREDGLFAFKRGFSDRVLPFRLTRRVLDPVAYRGLCAAAGVDADATGFFPAYRQTGTVA